MGLSSIRRGPQSEFRWDGDNLTRLYRGASSVSFEYSDDVLSGKITSRTRVSCRETIRFLRRSPAAPAVVQWFGALTFADSDEDVRGIRMTPSIPFGVHFTMEGRPWSEPWP